MQSSSQRRSFAVSYALLCAGFFGSYFIFAFPFSGFPYRVFTAYLHGYAWTAAAVLHVFDPSVAVAGNEITGRTSLAIVRGCDGTDVLILFAAAVLASPRAAWPRRVAGVVVGSAALSFANVLRICSLYCVRVDAPASLDLWHLEIWPLLLVALAVGLFLAWGRWIQGRSAATPRESIAA